MQFDLGYLTPYFINNIDPAKVTRYALQNATSIAGLMVTTEVMIADKARPESAGKGGGMPDMGGMGGMM